MEYPDCKILFCTYFYQKKEFEFKCEKYDDYTMFCVKNGSFVFRIDENESHQINAGQVVFCPPNQIFHREMLTPSDFCMIKLKADIPSRLCGIPITIYDISRYNINLDALTDCLFCYDMELYHAVKHFCRDIWYQTISQAKNDFLPLSGALQYIKKNFSSPISISDLAFQNGYSTGGFIALFKKTYSYSPKAYISLLRFNYAKQLLLSSKISIASIALKCGYADPLYFSKQFKKRTGVSPKEFRARWSW